MTPEQKKSYIKKKVNTLTVDQCRSIYNTIRSNALCNNAIRDANDVYIDLDKLTIDILDYIYNIVEARQEEITIIP